MIVEVKSVSRDLWAREIVSRRQKARLERARDWVELQTKLPTKLMLATVAPDGAIRYFDAPF